MVRKGEVKDNYIYSVEKFLKQEYGFEELKIIGGNIMIYKYKNKTYLFEGEKDIMKFIKNLQKSPK